MHTPKIGSMATLSSASNKADCLLPDTMQNNTCSLNKASFLVNVPWPSMRRVSQAQRRRTITLKSGQVTTEAKNHG